MRTNPYLARRSAAVRTRRRRVATLTFATTLIVAIAAMACASDSSAQTRALRKPIVKDDTSSVMRLLEVVRGVDPMLCELATRTVDMHGSWSRWGDLGDNPLHTDSSAAAVLDWIQHSHNDPALIPLLRAGMHDPDSCVRRISGSFLGRVDHPAASEALLVALDDPNAGTR